MAASKAQSVSKARMLVLALIIAAALVKGWMWILPAASYGFVLLWKSAWNSEGKRAGRVSWKWSLLVVMTFAFSLFAAGHGVMPLGLFLIWGWERYPVPVALGWIAVLSLAVGPWVRTAIGAPLAFAGGALALASWLILQARSDAPLATLPFSLPFVCCLAILVVHLWRTRQAAPTATA